MAMIDPEADRLEDIVEFFRAARETSPIKDLNEFFVPIKAADIAWLIEEVRRLRQKNSV